MRMRIDGREGGGEGELTSKERFMCLKICKMGPIF